MNTNFVRLSAEEWTNTFKPLPNHLDSEASWQDENNVGAMYETYGEELDFVRKMYADTPNYVWTYMDSDNGGTVIVDGYHLVNRIGYFITEVPQARDTTYEVLVSDPDECLCYEDQPCTCNEEN